MHLLSASRVPFRPHTGLSGVGVVTPIDCTMAVTKSSQKAFASGVTQRSSGPVRSRAVRVSCHKQGMCQQYYPADIYPAVTTCAVSYHAVLPRQGKFSVSG